MHCDAFDREHSRQFRLDPVEVLYVFEHIGGIDSVEGVVRKGQCSAIVESDRGILRRPCGNALDIDSRNSESVLGENGCLPSITRAKFKNPAASG